MDYYEILQVSRSADLETIKKQYQRLILQVCFDVCIYVRCISFMEVLIVEVLFFGALQCHPDKRDATASRDEQQMTENAEQFRLVQVCPDFAVQEKRQIERGLVSYAGFGSPY